MDWKGRGFDLVSALVLGLIAPGIVACAARTPRREEAATPPSKPVVRLVKARLMPLPGGLDDKWMFHSNNPEIIDSSGLVLATWEPRGGASAIACLDHPISGAVRIFSHHIFSDEAHAPGSRRLELAWMVRAAGPRAVRLTLMGGASHLSQPDAPFRPWPPVIEDASGSVYSGPGDRVARALLDRSGNIASDSWDLLPGQPLTVVATREISTDVAILPARNGRTTSLELVASGPVHLAEVAWVGEGSQPGPTEATWRALATGGDLVTPRETVATPEEGLPGIGIRYGRVGGLTLGHTWSGLMPPYQGDETWAFPVASVWKQRFGTIPVQSADMVARMPGSAYQSHGNYQVEYDLTLPLENASTSSRRYRLRLVRPLKARDGGLEFQDPPQSMVYFRGALAWGLIGNGAHRSGHAHLQIRGGEEIPPFLEVDLRPAATASVRVRIVMPADATPPQTLMLDSDAVRDFAVR